MAIEFKEDKNRKNPELLEYLCSLDEVTIPFACPYLKILPEEIKLIKSKKGDMIYEDPRKKYGKNSLVCPERFKQNGILECNGIKTPRMNKEGNLEGECYWPLEDKIVIEIKK